MKLSIIIPVYNEERTIEIILGMLQDISLTCKKEIIIVDDASNDGTISKITRFLSHNRNLHNIKLITHKINKGKGSAIRSGINKSSGDYILIQDADLEYNPHEISKLLKPLLYIKKNEKLAVYGTRFHNTRISIPPLYFFGNWFLTLITNILCNTRLTDMETGYKLIPRKFFLQNKIKSNHFDIEPEITVRLVKQKIKIIEVPISYKGRSHLAGKKLTVLDAYEALKALFFFRFIYN